LVVTAVDLGDDKPLRRLGIATAGVVGISVPVLGLTRRGDLRTKRDRQ